MPARRRTTFPGLDPRAAKEIIALQDDLLNELQLLRQEAIGSTTDTKQSGTYPVRFNERVRVSPAAAGVDLTFPAASSQNQNKWLEVLVLTAGNVRLRATAGLIQGVALLTLTAVGFYYFQSDGFSGWWMQPTGGGGGGSQGWDDTLVIDPTSGANNPIVSAGQFLQMGAVGPAAFNAQIRSGDSPFRIHGGAQLSLLGDTNVAASALGGAFSASGTTAASVLAGTGNATLQSTSGNAVVTATAAAVSINGATQVGISTASTSRIIFEVDGSWNVGGSNGAAGNVLTSNGAALPPTWQAAAAAAVAMTDATITLPYAGKQSDTVVVVDASITALSRIGIFWGTVLATDVNDPEADDISFTCTPAAGSMTVRVAAADALSRVGGPYKIRYLIG